jgi:UDP-N-acetylmuramyl tripeptide synthase
MCIRDRNRCGANLVGGIVSAFMDSVTLRGKCSASAAVLEVDEATVRRLGDLVQPEMMVVTNFFRDQLDRYGELYSVVESVRAGIAKFKNVKLVLNADDSLCVSLGRGVQNEVLYYGMEPDAAPEAMEKEVTSATNCVYCKERYAFSYRVLGHLGGFKCPGCGFERPQAGVKCKKVKLLEPAYSTAVFEVGGKELEVKIGVGGLYNVYNALAAAACCHLLGLPAEKTVFALEKFESCFGRMETINAGGGKEIRLILAKNPAGFNQIVRYLSTAGEIKSISFVINDGIQDSTDVSWLWDVDIEKLDALKTGEPQIIAAGIRAEDMALRLKYAGVPQNQVKIIGEYRPLLDAGLSSTPQGGTFFIVANYTAMMDIRRILKDRYGLKEITQ